MTFSARRATAADLPAIEAITRAAYEGYTPLLGRDPLPMRTDYVPRVAAGQVWMVRNDVSSVPEHDVSSVPKHDVSSVPRHDALCVLEHAPDHLLVYSLAVRPGAQGGGAGRWMLRFAEDEARRAGVGEVRLFTNAKMARNIAIYARAGYRETGRHAPDPDWPDWFVVDMAKALGAKALGA